MLRAVLIGHGRRHLSDVDVGLQFRDVDQIDRDVIAADDEITLCVCECERDIGRITAVRSRHADDAIEHSARCVLLQRHFARERDALNADEFRFRVRRDGEAFFVGL